MPSAGGVTAGKAFVMIEAVDKTGKVLQKVSQRMQAFAGRIKQIGMGMLALGAALSVPLASSIKAASTFSDEILTLQTALEITDKSMAGVEKTIRDLGATTSFTAQEVAAAGTELARGGFNKKEIQNSLKSVLDLARTGRIELPLAAKTMIQSIRVFNLSSKDAASVADKFALAAKRGTTNIEELGQAMSFTGGTAAELGFSLDETLAILSVVSSKMLSATKGGTSLNQMFTRLATESGKLKELGINPFDDEGKAKRGLAILMELSAVLRDMSQEKRLKTASDIFNVRGMRQALAIAGVDSVEKIIALTGEMGASFELAARDAEKMDSGMGGTFRRILSAFDELKLSIGDVFEGPIKAAEKIIVGFLNFLSNFAKENEAIFLQIGHGIAMMVGSGLGMIVLGTVASAVAAGIASIGSVVTALSAVSLPVVGIIIGAFVQLGLIVGWATAIFLGLSAGVNRIWSDIKGDVGKIYQVFKSNFAKIARVLKDVFIGLLIRIQRIFDNILGPVMIDFFKSMKEAVVELVPILSNLIVGGIQKFGAVLDFVAGVVIFVVSSMVGLVNILTKLRKILLLVFPALSAAAFVMGKIVGSGGGKTRLERLAKELELNKKIADVQKRRFEREEKAKAGSIWDSKEEAALPADEEQMDPETEAAIIAEEKAGGPIHPMAAEEARKQKEEAAIAAEERKKELRAELAEKAAEIAREKQIEDIHRREKLEADQKAIDDRRKAIRSIENLEIQLAKELNAEKAAMLKERLAEERKELRQTADQESRRDERRAMSEADQKKKMNKLDEEKKKLEKELGEKAAEVGPVKSEKFLPADFIGEKKLTPEEKEQLTALAQRHARLGRQIKAAEELRSRASGRSTSNIGQAFQKGSVAAAQQIIKTKFAQTQLKFLQSIDENIKTLKDLERKAADKLSPTVGVS